MVTENSAGRREIHIPACIHSAPLSPLGEAGGVGASANPSPQAPDPGTASHAAATRFPSGKIV